MKETWGPPGRVPAANLSAVHLVSIAPPRLQGRAMSILNGLPFGSR